MKNELRWEKDWVLSYARQFEYLSLATDFVDWHPKAIH